MRHLLTTTIVLLAVACAKETSTSTAKEKSYPMTATIVSRDPAKNTVNLDNKEVPGEMAAMKMDYEVRGARVASLPPDGTAVEATVHDAKRLVLRHRRKGEEVSATNGDTRAAAVRSGIRAEVVTIVWMIVEAVVAILAGVRARSVLVTAFGIDSVIELVSGTVLLWRIKNESSPRAEAIGRRAATIFGRSARAAQRVHRHLVRCRSLASRRSCQTSTTTRRSRQKER